MISIRQIIKGIRHPSKANDVIRRKVNYIDPNRIWYGLSNCNPDGKAVYDADWDNLILLDSARYDEFKRVNWLEGDLEEWTTLGTQTPQFVSCNFRGQAMHDLVIISVTVNYQKAVLEEGFEPHYIEVLAPTGEHPVQKRFFERGSSGWNMPGPVTERARWAAEEFPNKRLLIHYFQPHSPYIGKTGQEYFDGLPHHLGNFDPKGSLSIRDRNESLISDELLRRAYRENLEIAIQAVEELLPSLDGRTVISSDHGELLGERCFPIPLKYYGHPPRFYTRELTKVPWLIIDQGERKDIIDDTPRTYEVPGEHKIDERLRDLGYI